MRRRKRLPPPRRRTNPILAPMTVADLEAGRCQVPGCDHKGHDVLFMHSTCHIGGGNEVFYSLGSGVLTIRCNVCKATICEVKVDPGDPPKH